MGRTLLFCWLLVMPITLVYAQTDTSASSGNVEIQVIKEESAVKRLFNRMWSKLMGYVGRSERATTAAGRTLIAGVRGAESTTSGLQPYWKGDRSEDPDYIKEVDTFLDAMELADAGKFEQATGALNAFSDSYPNSSLGPNVQFALGLAYGQLGKNAKGVAALESFARRYPEHPLVSDATELIQILQLTN
jgi:TolA-binding protein